MTKEAYNVIGVMSGTSLDGIDLVYATLIPLDWRYNCIHCDTFPYPKKWHRELQESVDFNEEQLKDLDQAYTEFLADTILTFIKKYTIVDIDAVCSHGHTILHQPEHSLTYQIGNRPELASLIEQNVVCDFRVKDVELGGQGAPLVPIGDRLLFSQYTYCLNLGGFANVSFENDLKRTAFDICPVNIVMNHYSRALGFDYDDKGLLAASGVIDSELLKELNSMSYYSQKPPKSLGLEWVKEKIFPVIDSYELPTEDILRTFVEHISVQICKIFTNQGSVLITGGGAYNDFLMRRIKEISDCDIILPSTEIIEFKEALIFGLLGVLKLRNEVNCLSSVTGALRDHSSGNIFKP